MILRALEIEALGPLGGTWAPADHGLTVVVGRNGAGKSMLAVEALPWALWGESVRGAVQVPDGDVTAVLAHAGRSWEVSRRRSGRRSGFLRLVEGGRAHDGLTATETQARIDRVFGTWRQFAATRVFSRQLQARFATAKPSERKAVLEDLLGLDQFASAYKAALKHASAAETSLREAEQRARWQAEQVEAARKKIAKMVRPEVPAAQIEADIERTRVARDAALTTARDLRERWNRAGASRTAAQARLAQVEERDWQKREAVTYLRNRLQDVGDLRECPVCFSDLTGAAGQRVDRELRTREEAAVLEAAETAAEVAALQADLKEQVQDQFALEAACRTADAEATKIRMALSDLETAHEVARTYEQFLAEAEADLAEQVAKLGDLQTRARQAQEAGSVADHAVAVLGPRGARMRLFGAALASLEVLMNEALARLHPTLRVRLPATTKQASGKEVDDIALCLEGGDASTYEEASDGERTRVDVAFIYAASKRSWMEGIQVFDEVFDPLDDEGLEAVAAILAEQARDRQVVVVTHNPRFLALLPADKHVVQVVRDGRGPARVE
jgi:DNA repair exonuclease SbcCD ATPase subunit